MFIGHEWRLRLMNARVHIYVYSSLRVWLGILLGRSDCLFPVVLSFLVYN